MVDLIVADEPVLREQAEDLGIANLIYWGANTDPVMPCTAATVVDKPALDVEVVATEAKLVRIRLECALHFQITTFRN